MSVWEPRESVASAGAGGQADVGPGLCLDPGLARGQVTRVPEQLWLDGLEAAEDGGVCGGLGRGRGPGQQRTQVARVTGEVAGVLGVSGCHKQYFVTIN